MPRTSGSVNTDTALLLRAVILPALLLLAGAGGGAWLLRDAAAQNTQADARAQTESALRTLAITLSGYEREEIEGNRTQALLGAWARSHRLASVAIIDATENTPVLIAAGPEPSAGASTAEHTEPIPGAADLNIRATGWLPLQGGGLAQTLTPVALLAGAGALAAALVMGTSLGRVRELSLIAGALHAWNTGEREPEALALGPMFGSSEAWNDLVDRAAGRGASESATESDAPERSVEADRAVDALWHGICLIDGAGRIVRANGAASVLLGFPSAGELVGQPLRELLGDVGAERVLDETRDSGGSRRRSVTVTPESGGGRSLVKMTARSLPGAGEASVVVFLEDVTQQRAADAARNNFVAQATHELRTPLTNIRLHVEEAIDAGKEDPSIISHALNIINTESERLERTVSDMLSVSEIESGSLSLRVDDVRLDRLFESLSGDYTPQAESRNQKLTWELPPKFPVIRGDREKIQLAIHNVVGNALKYTPEGGRIRVRVEADEGSLIVEVSDTGMGIPAEDLDRIFDKFYRARGMSLEGIGGSGLGLALAREVVRLHGGDITVESKQGEGSTFLIRIPSAAAGARAA